MPPAKGFNRFPFSSSRRADERGRIARAYLEELLAGGDAEEGAFRLMRTRARLTDEARAQLETKSAAS
jgi:hypothetical protein